MTSLLKKHESDVTSGSLATLRTKLLLRVSQTIRRPWLPSQLRPNQPPCLNLLVFSNGLDLPEWQMREEERFDNQLLGSAVLTTSVHSKRGDLALAQ